MKIFSTNENLDKLETFETQEKKQREANKVPNLWKIKITKNTKCLKNLIRTAERKKIGSDM